MSSFPTSQLETTDQAADKTNGRLKVNVRRRTLKGECARATIYGGHSDRVAHQIRRLEHALRSSGIHQIHPAGTAQSMFQPTTLTTFADET